MRRKGSLKGFPWLQGLPNNPTKWTDMAKAMEGVSEETTTGVKRLYEMQVHVAPAAFLGVMAPAC